MSLSEVNSSILEIASHSWGFGCGVLILFLLEFQFEDKNLKTFEIHESVVKSSDGIHLLQPV